MDHQRRPIPAPQGNICPMCSISHFPFCPPYPPPPPPPHPPPCDQNPRFPPPHPPPDYPRPDPYHQALHYPYPSDGWHSRNNYNHKEGFGQPIYNDYSNSTSNSYVSEVDRSVDRSHKRPRVDEVGSFVFGYDNYHQNPASISMDVERRLKLVRDHGGAGSGNFASMQYNTEGNHQEFNASFVRNIEMNNNSNGNKNMYSPFQPHAAEVDNASFGNHDLQQNRINAYNSMSGKGPQYYSHMNNWQWQDRQPYGIEVNVSSAAQAEAYAPCHEDRVFGGQPPPPLPASPHPPLPMEPPVVYYSSEFKAHPSPPKTSMFPVPISSSATIPYLHNRPLLHPHGSIGFVSDEWQTSLRQYAGEDQNFLPNQLSPEKPTVIDASHLFKQPHRATRPDHIVIILRGLPGSGKSYWAKMMRDLEVENGGDAPRIHSMDDYFMTEVEKVDESDASKCSSFVRGKKPTVKKVMEYCYEPEMEEAYRDSMLKAFKKTLEEGIFTFVIVDDRNLRVADFAQFWAIAKRSGYEVYISEAAYKDPVGCAARNVHGFTLEEIKKMAGKWEEAPSLYLQLDIKSLFHGDDLKDNGIQEVDMDTEDGDFDSDQSRLEESKPEKTVAPPVENDAPHENRKRWDAEEDHHIEGVKELGKSKWSNDLDEDDIEGSEGVKGNLNALSGLIQAYKNRGKSVSWSDQAGNAGFSIGARKANMLSLVIGPGAGYNLKSNPLPEDDSSASGTGKSRRHSIFQARLRAEHESFKAVFDRRRHRIGLDLEEEQ